MLPKRLTAGRVGAAHLLHDHSCFPRYISTAADKSYSDKSRLSHLFKKLPLCMIVSLGIPPHTTELGSWIFRLYLSLLSPFAMVSCHTRVVVC